MNDDSPMAQGQKAPGVTGPDDSGGAVRAVDWDGGDVSLLPPGQRSTYLEVVDRFRKESAVNDRGMPSAT